MRIYWINEYADGALGMMARPRGNDWLEDEIKNLKKIETNILVSLLEEDEIEELGITQEGYYAQQHGLQFIPFPIRDRSVPEDEEDFIKLVDFLYTKLKEGAKIVIHCRMGIGRTGILIAAVLDRLGLKVEEAFEIMSKRRGLKMPDTKEQQDWVEKLVRS